MTIFHIIEELFLRMMEDVCLDGPPRIMVSLAPHAVLLLAEHEEFVSFHNSFDSLKLHVWTRTRTITIRTTTTKAMKSPSPMHEEFAPLNEY